VAGGDQDVCGGGFALSLSFSPISPPSLSPPLCLAGRRWRAAAHLTVVCSGFDHPQRSTVAHGVGRWHVTVASDSGKRRRGEGRAVASLIFFLFFR
jgi:hypothetical protein